MTKQIAASFLCFCTLWLIPAPAHAQQIDAAFGINTLTAPAATATVPQSLTGGFYPTIGGDFLFFHHLGVGGEVSWRASRSFYQADSSLPYRPVLFDFNAVFAPPITHKLQPEFQAGLGAEDIRFYSNAFCNFFTGTCYATSKHFLGHFGFGLKFYVLGNFFVRPEVHVYLVNNNVEFSFARATRYGISIGYTIGSH